jgi:protein involved in polysaccharide export with SLBB domain
LPLLAHAQTLEDLDPTRRDRRSANDAPALSPAAPAPAATPQSATSAAALLEAGETAPGGGPPMFGQQIFRGAGVQSFGGGFNRDYVLSIGDRVALRMWGAFTYDATQPVDAQGNVFVPNVGPIRLAGVRNENLNEIVRLAVMRVYRNNVGVYASLDSSQPVRLFVTGYVRLPGQYGGVAGESVLGYLARAGGVDAQRGSYVDIRLLRGRQEVSRIDLYRFLLEGRLESPQLQDGDTLVVGPRLNSVAVTGDVFNAYTFEFAGPRISAADLLQLARPKPEATHVSIVRKTGPKQLGEYHALARLEGVTLGAGDEISVVSDRSLGTILVRVDGAHEGLRVLSLPYGARLKEALSQVQPTPQAQLGAVQLFRQSVVRRQKELIEVSLRNLETYALTARSTTNEESQLRVREAELITRFVERARSVQPRGQVVLAARETMMDVALEDGDVLFIPERSSTVMVHGEVTFPNAIVYDSKSTVADYVRLAGGMTQQADDARILLARQDGTIEEGMDVKPRPGDEILVLPKVTTKKIEVTRGITQILYQIAVAAKIVFGL